MRHNIALSLFIGLCIAAPALSQNATNEHRQVRDQPAGSQNRGKAAVNDALFAAAAAESGLSELSLSELGAQQATDPELKRFSEKMMEEHTRMNGELKILAARKNLALPTQVSYASQFCVQSLAGLSGQEFDRCYAKAQLVAHMQAVALFEAAAKRGTDPDTMALASEALPKIKEHLRMIKPLAKNYMLEEEASESSRDAREERTPKASK